MANFVDSMIASGNYKPLLDAVKGFRNGFVYGCKVRAPHSLVMTLLWSRGPIQQMATRIFNATLQHGMNLAKFAFIFKLFISLLGRLQGRSHPVHAALGGALCGFLFWGDGSPVAVQVNMYLLSRIISGFLFLLAEKYGAKLPAVSFRCYAAAMWASVMFLFYHHPHVLQGSLQSSMKYIYRESDAYTNASELLLRSSANTF